MDIASTFDHEPFRHGNEKYFAGVGGCKVHCKKCARWVMYASAIAAVLLLIGLVFNVLDGTFYGSIFHAVIAFLFVVVTLLLFWGIRTENEKLLLPYVAFMALVVAISVFLVVVSLISLISPRSAPAQVLNNVIASKNDTLVADNNIDENRGAIQAISTVSTVICLFLIVICIFVAFAVFKYYIYLRDMKRARNPRNEVHHEISSFNKTKLTQ